MRALTRLEQECADALALALADAFCTAIPALFSQPPEAVLSITAPVASALVRAESKAARSRKHAKKYRRLQREVREILRTERETAVPAGVLTGTVAFDPETWHVELRRGIGPQVLEVSGDAP